GRLQKVGARVALSSLDDEKRFDVAEDGEAECGRRGCVEAAKRRQCRAEAALSKLDVSQRRNLAGRIQADNFAGADAGERRRRSNRVGGRQRVGVGRDVKIEVDANSLEEIVVEANKSHFNRHLQILQTAKLPEQVGN